MLSKVLVANRGEIAVRIIRTCAEAGVASVAVYSEADEKALHVRLADEAVLLGAASASESYLAIDKIIEAAKSTGAQAVHPGYGFLAENAAFAKAVEDAGLIFIGPPSSAIEVMGSKIAARDLAAKADVPQVPGSQGTIASVADVIAFGDEHGYPVAIKATYGGGGRGMRTVASASDAESAFASAKQESAAAFGRDDVYLERYLSSARHVEVQVFADTHGNAVWIGDRDCSVQRRHQKLIEEAPAPGLSDELRRAMGEASVRLAKQVRYVGAGTVEFLVEADREAFYFLEMNTRIQVEHPVTEMTLGLDLVAEQLAVAAGEPLSITESGAAPRGHAIEVRVNAEDTRGALFMPSPGPIATVQAPTRAGVRWDGGYESGDEVQPYYDSLVGKLIVWAPTRDRALDRLTLALDELIIDGVPTTVPAARQVIAHKDFRNVAMHTNWLERDIDFASLLPPVEDLSDTDAEDTEEMLPRNEGWVGDRRYVIPFFTPAGPAAAAPVAEPQARRAATGGPRKKRGGGAAASGEAKSPMQGTVAQIDVEVGAQVEAGQVLMVLEAMKMQNPIRAAVNGVVESLHVEVGQVVAAGASLATVAAAGE
ncbi:MULTISPECIES: acetyl/propionyl/methylcrotonyl-CoA carboxylase subunit alpha [Rhodococcus]|uniref:acetyl/propionyl/methylcrotonyl-CoA carboxylase subunit alpha n=1 Tax=Rhodococcus TaxID=1827 RepID=UPI0007CD4FE2|nr:MULTISPECIES: acetyl-CoA carboxylase biotin carboxylase subunit [Rhodococcus]NHU43712.1 acetyl-CoA carboxylase biotin carboxylase subunit [Rhodococcus sp. A14]MDI9939664.1 acetyl-CoA carboxylase biotin carboxylase subunit [Rhodococcus sp. IEGM 1351]MDJ0415974.1 acetyl-CoA carboxylase biotin carboxylase subunit [Rhodococcus opacus]MDX5967486.1 acetyl-CoA carboxylase biotin carboxylase subunit [Rhodococcus opacus]NKY71320.1 acetyl-CoA carboxylase biotin carboxylase subunit [Rhodococcus opacus